jgi:MFS family permease
MASEMLYPIMPIYLKSIGFSVVFIGLLEGLAEAVAGLSKGYFGKISDHTGRRMPFVQWGYGLSTLSKPMMGLFVFPLWIFLARTLDRLGKGLRTGARDAMLSEASTPETKGKVFGFHRSMDTLGAVLGPAFALLYLQFYPDDLRTLFFIAFAPGCLAVICSFWVKDSKQRRPLKKKLPSFFSFGKYWVTSPPEYRKLLIGLLFFTLFNSSDVFLLLKMKESGMDDTRVILAYIFYNLVYAILAFPMGYLADRIGLKKVFLMGLFVFAIVYIGMSVNRDPILFYVLFFLYGAYAAATEGISKAWISNISDGKDTATAIGTYTAFQSICALLASFLAGLLWYTIGATFTFVITAIAVLFVIVYLMRCKFKFEHRFSKGV